MKGSEKMKKLIVLICLLISIPCFAQYNDPNESSFQRERREEELRNQRRSEERRREIWETLERSKEETYRQQEEWDRQRTIDKLEQINRNLKDLNDE